MEARLLFKRGPGRAFAAAVMFLIVFLQPHLEGDKSPYLWEDPFIMEIDRAWVQMLGASAEAKRAAANILLKAVAGEPDHPYADDALFQAGLCLEACHEYQDALGIFSRVIREYPDGCIVLSPAWVQTEHMISVMERAVRTRVPHSAEKARSDRILRQDAQKALELYHIYMQAHPELTANRARYRIACLYLHQLNGREKALQVLRQIKLPSVREAAITKHQDERFSQRLDQEMPQILQARYMVSLRPGHRLAGQVRRLRVHLGLEREQKLTPEQEAEAKAEALKRLDAFWQEHKPQFRSSTLMEEEAEPEQKEK